MDNLPYRSKIVHDEGAELPPLDVFSVAHRPRHTEEGINQNNGTPSDLGDEIETEQPAPSNAQAPVQTRSQRRNKAKRFNKAKKKADEYAKVLGLDRSKPGDEAKLQVEIQESVKQKSRNGNPQTQAKKLSSLSKDTKLLCGGIYWTFDYDVLINPEKNSARINNLEAHFERISETMADLRGKHKAREDFRLSELDLRKRWAKGEVSEEAATAEIKNIAFGLRVVKEPVLKFIGLTNAGASRINSSLPTLKWLIEGGLELDAREWKGS